MNRRINKHIIPDEKFYNAFINNQEKFVPNSKNDYYIIRGKEPLIHHPENSRVKVQSIKEIKEILQKSTGSKHIHIIFHSLPTSYRKQLLRHIPDGIKTTWIFYGYEYYHRRDVIEEYLSPKTRKYYNSWQNPNLALIKMHHILDWIRNEEIEYKNDLQKIHRFAHWNPEEYELIRDQFQLDQIEYIPFAMGLKIHEVVPDHDHRYLLIGHSGALTVNHLDGIEALDKKFIDGFERVLIPFSYGANKAYEDKVRKAAHHKMGNKVIFLDRFIDRSSYFNLLSRVKVAWMPQLRGMGGGNILFCLKNNIPVVFWRESLMYRYYKERGFHVFAINDIGTSLITLTADQKQINQNMVNKYFGEDTIKKHYQNLLSL